MKRGVCAVLCLLAAGCLLPATRQMADFASDMAEFTINGSPTMLAAGDLEQRMPGEGPLFVEYGVDSVFVADYTRGGERYHADVYMFESTSGAMGAYLARAIAGSNNLDIGYRGRNEDSTVQFVKGYFYLSVSPGSGGTMDGAAALATELASRIEGGYITPDLFETLPQENLDEGSEFYYKGPRAFALRHGEELANALKIAEAVDGISVTYLLDGHPVELLRITYPDREETLSAMELYIAWRHRPAIRSDLNLNYVTVINTNQTEDYIAEMGDRLYVMTGARQGGGGKERFEYILRGGK